MEFLSKGHKARYLASKGLREVGDRVRGAPYDIDNNVRKQSKAESLDQTTRAWMDAKERVNARI